MCISIVCGLLYVVKKVYIERMVWNTTFIALGQLLDIQWELSPVYLNGRKVNKYRVLFVTGPPKRVNYFNMSNML